MVHQIEGWSVSIDSRLLERDTPVGRRALTLARDQLRQIRYRVGKRALADLLRVEIQLDLTHGALTSMQYHPSAEWLRNNGYATNLARRVHIPDATRYSAPHHTGTQPWAMLHELAHAYHHQVLSYDHEGIRSSFNAYRESGRGDPTRHVDGRPCRHYALTNEKEFFAEMTEAYFGINDFMPFTHEDLRESEPEIYSRMEAIWGPVNR